MIDLLQISLVYFIIPRILALDSQQPYYWGGSATRHRSIISGSLPGTTARVRCMQTTENNASFPFGSMPITLPEGSPFSGSALVADSVGSLYLSTCQPLPLGSEYAPLHVYLNPVVRFGWPIAYPTVEASSGLVLIAVSNGTIIAMQLKKDGATGNAIASTVWERHDLAANFSFVEAAPLLYNAPTSGSSGLGASGTATSTYQGGPTFSTSKQHAYIRDQTEPCLVVAGYSGFVAALRASDGTTRWQAAVDQPVATAPALTPDGTRVALPLQSAEIAYLRAGTGERTSANVRLPSPASGTSGGAAAWSGGVLVGNVDGKLYSANVTSAPQVGVMTSTGFAVDSSPAVWESGGVARAVVGSDDYHVYGISLQDGAALWTAPTGDWVAASPLIGRYEVVGSMVGQSTGGSGLAAVIGSNDGLLRAIDAGTGALLWAIDPTESACALMEQTSEHSREHIREQGNGYGLYASGEAGLVGTSGVVRVGPESASEIDSVEPAGSQPTGAMRRLLGARADASSSSAGAAVNGAVLVPAPASMALGSCSLGQGPTLDSRPHMQSSPWVGPVPGNKGVGGDGPGPLAIVQGDSAGRLIWVW